MANREGKSFNIWFESIRGSSTEAQRLGFIESFLKWRGISYEDFYQEYYSATRSTDPRDLAAINSNIVSFYKDLRSKGLSSGYAKNHVGTVVGFLQENGLSVNFTKAQRREMVRKIGAFKDNWTKEEIRQLLSATTSLRNMAIIHALKDTGMAVSDLADLKISDLKRALDNGDKFAVMEYVRNKTEEHGSPCFGFESLDAIRVWLRWRAEKGYNCGPDSPLFILVQNQQGGGKYSKEELFAGVPMNGEAMTGVILKVVKRAGLTDKRLSAHCFRIFNASALESSGVNKNIVYRAQARQIPDSGKTYSKGEVLSSYMKAYDALAVGPKPQIIEIQDSRVADLEAKLVENEASKKDSEARLARVEAALLALSKDPTILEEAKKRAQNEV
jgi:site-specific recombinase XerD